MKTHRIFLSLLLLLAGTTVSAQSYPDKPNIVWIVSEDNSADFLRLYGGKNINTPHIDALAEKGIVFDNAICTAPVCAPSRSTLITGMYPTTLGTENMRSTYAVPDFVHFFPYYLKQAGYYTTNNSKKDYNTEDQPGVWDESSNTATYKNRKPDQPFFAVFNIQISHESSIQRERKQLRHQPEQAEIPPYLPSTNEIKRDFAQYYDVLEDMDSKVGELVKDIEDSGLLENTIIFYYGDNGGVLPRSKRFMYENGLHIPLVVRIPEKYKTVFHQQRGTRSDKLVTFADFAPTVLNLAGVQIPDYFQGQPFLGKNIENNKEYSFAFRGRMDERIDLVRAARGKKYLYIRNFYPHVPYGAHIDYLWNARGMQSWEKAYHAGELNKVQVSFFNTKPTEELYDLQADPYNINNLAVDSAYKSVLVKMRQATHHWLLSSVDAGFIPEAKREEINKNATVYDYAHSADYPAERVIETAEIASLQDSAYLNLLISRLTDTSPEVRYWAAIGCTILHPYASKAIDKLVPLLKDPEVAVRISAAEALYHLGLKNQSLSVLLKEAKGNNLMGSVQALNVFNNISLKDLTEIRSDLEKIKTEKAGARPDFQARLVSDLLNRLSVANK